MKISSFKWLMPFFAVFTLWIFPDSTLSAQDFQRLYGTNLDNTFSKVIRDGANYYVLGQDEPSNGATPNATVTRLDANGIHQWTLSLNIPSVWNDAVLTPSGDLFVVGYTLPFDATNKSLMGLVTPAGGGNFTWIRTYDVTGREGNTKIVRSPSPQNVAFPYYVLGFQFDANGGPIWDDIILLNVDESGTFNWKKRFPSTDDDEFARDLEVMSNGDLILAGNKGTQGVIISLDNSGALVSGVTPDGLSFSYADVSPASGGGFYAVGGTFPSFTAYLMKYDNSFITVWDATISDLTSVSQVWEVSANDGFYVTGTGVYNGISRAVILHFKEIGNAPVLQSLKYLDNGETSYSGGSTTFLPPNQMAFGDGRTPTTGGFGQNCAFMSVNDLQLTTCMTSEDVVDVLSLAIIYSAPFIPAIEFFDFPTGTGVSGSALNWQQEDACNNNPCQADFIITPIGNCGHYQVTNTSTGALPLTYSWCNGSTAQDLDVMLPCGPHTFCLTITDAEGCTSSYTESVTVTDNIPPVARCALPFGVVLDADCTYTLLPSQIDGGSTDNCQILSMSISPAVLTGCGVFPVTLTVTDWCGNVSTCSTMVQTIEDVPPIIQCPSNQQLSTSATSCNMVVNGIQWTSLSDNCSNPTVTYVVSGASNYSGAGDASGLIFDQGASTVTYTAIDDCGNTTSCAFEVNVTCICDCPDNLLLNSGFYEGAVPGNNLGISGESDHWLSGGLSPQVVQEDSCCDAYSIQLWGNYYNGESIYQQGLNIQAGHHYKISFCARYWPGYPNVNSINFGFNAASSTTNPYNCQPCEQIGLSPQITSTSWGAYTMPIWTPTQNHNLIYIRAVSITGYQSWGRIDNICIEEVPYTCCGDEDAFVANMHNAVTFSFDESTQEGICTIGNLPECDSVAYIDWGDGNIDVGPFGGNTVRRNRFLNHLLARVQFQAHEYNADTEPDETCFEHVFMDSIDVYSLDSCVCTSFSELFIRGPRGEYSQVIGCGEPPFALNCLPSGAGYDLTGLFQCAGDQCTGDANISWSISGPGEPQAGNAFAGPYFSLHFPATFFAQPGLYTLSLSGVCGNQNCICEIQFSVDCPDPCPCTPEDIEAFRKERDMLLAQVMRVQQGCNVIFSPIGLSDCETVEWFVEDTLGVPIGISEGNDPFAYDFLESGTYTVITQVTKKKDDGSKCDKLMRTQEVTVACQPAPECVEALIDNPSFAIGAHAGGLNSGGTSRGWNGVSGEPEVIEGEPGSSDGWTILLSGNLDTAAVLSRIESICLDKVQGTFRSTVKSSKSNSNERTIPRLLKVFLGRGWSFPPTFSIRDGCEGMDCYELASVHLPVSDTSEWFEVEIPYDLSDWLAVDSCNDFTGVLVRPVIYVTNTLGSSQGVANTYTYVQLDNVCFNRTLVAVDDPASGTAIQVYPNPNTGEFMVELKEPASQGMTMRIVSLTGQVLLERYAVGGSVLQVMEAKDLAEGMYFLQVVSGSLVTAVEKFVKQ